MVRAFLTEPTTIALGLDEALAAPAITSVTRTAAREGLSVIAREATTGKIVGCLIARDFNAPPPDGFEAVAAPFAPLFALLSGMEESFRARSAAPVPDGAVCVLIMAGVDEAYRGARVLGRMCARTEQVARERSFRALLAEATGAASQQAALQRLGFEVLERFAYRDFVFEGRNVFASIESVDSCALIHKPL